MSDLQPKPGLQQLSSPEELDQLLNITTPKGWLALLAIGVLLVVALVWSFVGTIPTKVSGCGILILTEDLMDVVSDSSGRLVSVEVQVGQAVEAGQVVARIAQQDLIDKVRSAQDQLAELKEQDAAQTKLGQQALDGELA